MARFRHLKPPDFSIDSPYMWLRTLVNQATKGELDFIERIITALRCNAAHRFTATQFGHRVQTGRLVLNYLLDAGIVRRERENHKWYYRLNVSPDHLRDAIRIVGCRWAELFGYPMAVPACEDSADPRFRDCSYWGVFTDTPTTTPPPTDTGYYP